MIVYNVTVKVDDEVKEEWLQWMRETHIPDVMKTGCFVENQIMRLKFPKDEEGQTFAIQYVCKSMGDLDEYHRNFATALKADHHSRFGNHVVAFRTILERLES